jgi:8-oxo-dGTP pyrophosphatase MutT (NUDIX family)
MDMSTNQHTVTNYGRFDLHQEHKDGDKYPKVWISPGDVVAVIPYNDKGFWLGQQYRRPVDDYVLSTCAGMIDPGETPLDAAKRELVEELGMTAETFHNLGGFYTSEGITDEYTYLFAAENPKLTFNGPTDADEGVISIFNQWKDVPWLIENGKNAKLLIGVMKLDRFRQEEAFHDRYGPMKAEHRYTAVLDS